MLSISKFGPVSTVSGAAHGTMLFGFRASSGVFFFLFFFLTLFVSTVMILSREVSSDLQCLREVTATRQTIIRRERKTVQFLPWRKGSAGGRPRVPEPGQGWRRKGPGVPAALKLQPGTGSGRHLRGGVEGVGRAGQGDEVGRPHHRVDSRDESRMSS